MKSVLRFYSDQTELLPISQKSSGLRIVKNVPGFAEQLRSLPVAINALADPAILRSSSAAKLDMLVADKHKGPVAIITKGNLDTDWWRERLPVWCNNLDLYIFASISGLPKQYEPVPLAPRFKTLRVARDYGAKSIAYVRPIIPGVNDTPEILGSLIEQASQSGCHAVVSSGFRGATSIVDDSGFKDKQSREWQNGWLPSVKLHTQPMEDFVRDMCSKRGIQFWTGTACAVAALSSQGRSTSPYHIASQFARCDLCSIKDSCYENRHKMQPAEGSLELLRHLGYKVDFFSGTQQINPCPIAIRSDCSLHCTNCKRAPELNNPHLILRRWDGSVPTWGDLCFARFVTGGMVCTHPELSDREVSTIELHPRFGLASTGAGSLYATTTWMMWSEYLPKNDCFRCSYCFVGMYKEALPAPMQGTVGISPVRILTEGEQEYVN